MYRLSEYEANYVLNKLDTYGAICAFFENGHLSRAAIESLTERGLLYLESEWEGFETYRLTEAGIASVYEKNMVGENGKRRDTQERAKQAEQAAVIETAKEADGAMTADSVKEIAAIASNNDRAEAHAAEHAEYFAQLINEFIASFAERQAQEPHASVGGCEWLRGGRYEDAYARLTTDELQWMRHHFVAKLANGYHDFIDGWKSYDVGQLEVEESMLLWALTAKWDANGDAQAERWMIS